LEELHFVKKRGGEYDLSLGFLRYGKYGMNRIPFLDDLKSTAEKLAEETGEFVGCFILEGNYAVLVHVGRGQNSIKTNHSIGSYELLHCIASGKAMLANLSDQRINKFIEESCLPQKTDNTITESNALLNELETVRESGVAYNNEESVEGVKSVATCLKSNDVVAAIGISGPADRLVGDLYEDEFPRLIKGAVNEIQLNIEYSDTIL
jgi:DNA-binding IclR family transcriptional regulator